jgi:hypothetical protein
LSIDVTSSDSKFLNWMCEAFGEGGVLNCVQVPNDLPAPDADIRAATVAWELWVNFQDPGAQWVLAVGGPSQPDGDHR